MKRYIDRDVLADYACRHYGGLTANATATGFGQQG